MADRFGGIDPSEIEAIAKEEPDLELAGATVSTRFANSVADLVRLRAAKGEADGVAVFVWHSNAITQKEKIDLEEKPLLRGGEQPILGSVWLTDARIGTAFRIKSIDSSMSDQLFQQIRNLELSTQPAVVVQFGCEAPKATFYFAGIDKSDVLLDIALKPEEIGVDAIKSCLDNFFETTLRTPARTTAGHGTKVWSDAGKGIPVNRPEEKIHGRLKDHLRAKFTTHKISSEGTNDAGRYDIRISRHINDQIAGKYVKHEWLLELKALCDMTCTGEEKGSPGEYRGAVLEGVQQAHLYREEENAENSALCCYDLRKEDVGDDECFCDVAKLAGEQSVFLWRWFLLRSSRAVRAARYAN